LYDYGRPRELHLEHGLRVMKTETAAGKVAARAMEGFTRLIEQQYFVVDRYDLEAGSEVMVLCNTVGCLVGLNGTAAVIGGPDGPVELLPGQAVVLPRESQTVTVEAGVRTSFVRCFVPAP
jgi:mannose-6-phosphate isomerase